MNMNILNYIKKNWENLPKSLFNTDEVVIFHCVTNEDYGYGHHTYEGYGADKDGNLMWCYSSGCSCEGSCKIDHKKDIKTFVIDGVNVKDYDWKKINFNDLTVSFSDY